MYRVVTGSFSDKKNAEDRVKELKAKGFDSFLDAYQK
jgi:N-acetylmuramoyl-L-alanine amidase